MVPIHLPPAEKPTDAILEAEAALMERDGCYHVGGLYFAKQSDAAFVRRLEAERIVREQERQARRCVWCAKPINDGETFMEIAGRNLHDPKCTNEFDEWAYRDQDSPPVRLEPVRHSDIIPDNTLVWWEGEPTTWGTLSGNERMACERNSAGVLVGGYPL
jgi:hypothetical protein